MTLTSTRIQFDLSLLESQGKGNTPAAKLLRNTLELVTAIEKARASLGIRQARSPFGFDLSQLFGL